MTNSFLTSKQRLARALLAKAERSRRSNVPSLLEWTALNRLWIDPKNLFDLAQHRYLVDFYVAEAQEIVVKKAAQLGLSEWLVSYTLHACDVRGLDALYLMPTLGDVSDFSQTRFGQALEASPYLDSIVVPAAADKRGADKISLKRIRDSFIYFRGGQVGKEGKARQLKSIPVDVLVEDEVDEQDPRAIEIARKRLGHSEVAEVRAISTPSFPGEGIDAMWAGSDQREWMVPCPACNQWQQITINHVVTEWDGLERPVAWHGQREGSAWPVCEKCGGRLDRLAAGRWVARYPGRAVVGYHPTKFASALTDLLQVVRNLQTVDETKRREAFNQDLGECYTPRGGQLTDSVLDGCRREYGHGPRPGLVAYMGIDVGAVLHVVVRTPLGADGANEQIFAGEVDSFEEAGRLARRFEVGRVVMDALPETRKAREFQASFAPGLVWLAYYQDDTRWANWANWNEKEGVVTLDRTRIFDEVYARFHDEKALLPANAREIKDYYSHLKAPVRVLVDGADGTKKARYLESSADHLAHAELYCHAALFAPIIKSTTVSRSVKVDL